MRSAVPASHARRGRRVRPPSCAGNQAMPNAASASANRSVAPRKSSAPSGAADPHSCSVESATNRWLTRRNCGSPWKPITSVTIAPTSIASTSHTARAVRPASRPTQAPTAPCSSSTGKASTMNGVRPRLPPHAGRSASLARLTSAHVTTASDAAAAPHRMSLSNPSGCRRAARSANAIASAIPPTTARTCALAAPGLAAKGNCIAASRAVTTGRATTRAGPRPAPIVVCRRCSGSGGGPVTASAPWA